MGTGVGLSKDDPDSKYVDSRLRDFWCVQKDRVEMVLDGAATHQPSTSEVFLKLSDKGHQQMGLRKQALKLLEDHRPLVFKTLFCKPTNIHIKPSGLRAQTPQPEGPNDP